MKQKPDSVTAPISQPLISLKPTADSLAASTKITASSTPDKSGPNNRPMSNQARNTWAKKELTAAFLQLLKKKPPEEITVSELCKAAGTGRVTFYRNYQDMNAILRQYLLDLNKEWTDKMALDGRVPFSDLILLILGHFEEHREFYQLLRDRHRVWMLKDVIMSAGSLRTDGPLIEAYSSAFLVYLLYGWIEIWFERGMKDSPEELSAILKAGGR
ncbi:MAG: TetR/AcrR family transcriptional regulator [Eubacterium sp.]|nr:TetR/AcrR family transcriptional regulator [Eubacterium sp.]